MKVKDLKALLERMNDEDTVVILAKTLSSNIGGQSYVELKSAYAGFDWDDGKVFIVPAQPVHEIGERFEADKKRTHEISEALGFLYYSFTHSALKTPQQKIRAVRNTLERFGFKNLPSTPD